MDYENKDRLCPFKKMTQKETDPNTGRTVTHELFELCAGKRCMAFRDEHRPKCMRIEQ